VIASKTTAVANLLSVAGIASSKTGVSGKGGPDLLLQRFQLGDHPSGLAPLNHHVGTQAALSL